MPFIQYSYTLYATETGETRKGKNAKLNFEAKGATVFLHTEQTLPQPQ